MLKRERENKEENRRQQERQGENKEAGSCVLFTVTLMWFTSPSDDLKFDPGENLEE